MSNPEPIEYPTPAHALADAGMMLLMGTINEDTVRPVIEWILHENFCRKKKNKELLLMICSEGGNLEDALMHRVKEMLGLHQLRDPVVNVVVCQDRAQQLLFGLDVVGQGFGIGFGPCGRHGSQRGDLGHLVLGSCLSDVTSL